MDKYGVCQHVFTDEDGCIQECEIGAGSEGYCSLHAEFHRDGLLKKNAKQEAELERLRAEIAKWKRIRTPTHGSCCTCQACGLDYDSCRCDLDDVADELERLRAENGTLLDALIWCSGSSDFHEGGIAREGWLKLCQPLLDVARELDAREESHCPECGGRAGEHAAVHRLDCSIGNGGSDDPSR